MSISILVATTNPGKMAELSAMLEKDKLYITDGTRRVAPFSLKRVLRKLLTFGCGKISKINLR